MFVRSPCNSCITRTALLPRALNPASPEPASGRAVRWADRRAVRRAAARGRERVTGDRGPPHQRGRLFPLSIRTWLALVMLLPLAVALGLASTVVVSQLSTRRHAESTHQASSTLDSLLRDRVAVYDEYVPSEALVAAHAYGSREQSSTSTWGSTLRPPWSRPDRRSTT